MNVRRCFAATSAAAVATTISALRLLVLVWVSTRMATSATADNSTNTVDPCREFNDGGLTAMNEFASPGYPNRYRPGLDCVRIIYAPPHYDVIIHFNGMFQIETSYELTLPIAFPRYDTSRCPNDFLEVRDGRYGFSPLIGRFCGMTVPQFEVRATSGYVYMRFHSDYLLEYAGFHAEYEFVRSDIVPTYEPDCHIAHSYALDGFIDLSAMRHLYDTYRNGSKQFDCVWRIEVPATMSVAIFVQEFELATPNSCDENFVEIYAGATAQEPIKKYCGVTASHTFTHENIVYVRVFAAGPKQVKNSIVKALFSTYTKSKNCTMDGLIECGDDSCIPPSLKCNGRLNCLYGSDEKQCSAAADAFQNFIMSSYTPLLLVVFFIFLIIILMCVWARPCRYRIRRPPQGYESYLKQLSINHATALHYGMFSGLPMAYPRRTDECSEREGDENFSSKMTDLGKTITESTPSSKSNTSASVSTAVVHHHNNCNGLKTTNEGDNGGPVWKHRESRDEDEAETTFIGWMRFLVYLVIVSFPFAVGMSDECVVTDENNNPTDNYLIMMIAILAMALPPCVYGIYRSVQCCRRLISYADFYESDPTWKELEQQLEP